MITEILTGALPTDFVNEEFYTADDGSIRPTGHYPNLSGHIMTPLTWPDLTESDRRGYDTVATGVLDSATTVDQHPAMYVTATWTPSPDVERPTGHHDPLTDGPTQPDVVGISKYYYRESGTSQTHLLDRPGVEFPKNGSQDGDSWTYFQASDLAMAPYNPGLQTWDQQSGNFKSGMPDTTRALAPSPVHGWVQQPADTGMAAMPFPEQMVPGRNELLAVNPFAGQSFSAHTAHVPNQSGTVPSMRKRV